MTEGPGGSSARASLGTSGIWLAATGLSFLVAGVAAGTPTLTLLGGLPLLALVWAVLLARTIAWSDGPHVVIGDLPASGELRLRAGGEIILPLSLEGALAARLGRLSLTAGAVPPLEARVEGPPEQRRLRLSAPRVGHAWLMGFHLEAEIAGGLVVLGRWLPHPVPLLVLPRRFPLRGDPPLAATRASLQDRAGLGRARRRGFGLEIRELRDHQPGDPFKHIAWAATARRGKLVSREFESNLMLSAWTLVDVSPSMFWGQPGLARVDFAIETAHNLTSLLLSRGDRAGVMLYDERVRLSIRPSSRRGQLYRVLDGLLEAPHLVHQDRTEVTDRELEDRVARWFHAQQGRRFDLPPGLSRAGGPRHSPYDGRAMLEAVRAGLVEAARSRRRPPLPFDGYAPTRDESHLRAFCRHVGIPLPADPTPRPGAQARGLEEAVETVLRAGSGPYTLVIISDLHTVEDLEALRRAALGARRHHHAVIILCPADPAFEALPGAPTSPLGDALMEVEQLRARQNVATVEAILGPAGVTVLSCSPGDVMPRLLHRLDHVA